MGTVGTIIIAFVVLLLVIVGASIGTASSIFVATPILLAPRDIGSEQLSLKVQHISNADEADDFLLRNHRHVSNSVFTHLSQNV